MSRATRRALLGDVGGTNVRFALADLDGAGSLLDDSIRTYKVADHPSLEATARQYAASVSLEASFAVLAVAGPVHGDEVRMTNHAWVISARRVSDALGLQAAYLVNDFVAQAASLRLLRATDILVLGTVPWRPLGATGTYAIVGPGTGLGVGGLLLRGGRNLPLATEGGHAGFAPRTAEEIDILQRLSARYGRVSNERMLSGAGLVNIHQALGQAAGEDAAAMQPADVTAGASAGDARCLRAVDIFCAVLGAVAGDLALTLGAWDGVYLSGGIVPRVLDALQRPAFRQRFEDKGRYAAAMATVPTLAVLHPQPGLLGAAALATDPEWLGERQ